MSRLYIFMLGFTAILISSIGAFFSIVGLTHLFAGAAISVGLMAGSLELAKIVVAGFLYRYWGHINKIMRTYLGMAVVMLSGITSLGIFGYLSHAYATSALETKTQQIKIEQYKHENVLVQVEIKKIEQFISEIPASRISKKFALYEESRKEVTRLNQRSSELLNTINELQLKNVVAQAEIGPLLDVSNATGIPVDTIAKFLILVFVSVFDPLAICLVFAWGLAVRLREKYRGDENKISTLAMSKPVDHRFKKAA